MKNLEANVSGRSALRGVIVALAMFLLAFSSASAVDLFVSGILTPAAANGRYVPNGTYSGYDSWVHESGGYYIYNDFYSAATPALRYWNIDNDFNDEGSASVYFYSNNNSDGASPALVTAWGIDQGTGAPIVNEGSANPEIDIQGNSITLADGSTAVTLINHTHFGSVNLSGGSITRTFTIRNLGAAAVTLSGASPYVTVSGAQAANFVVSAAPAASIPSAGSTTFQVTFTPTAAGNHNATVSISSNDSDESPYTFAILGRGFTPRDLVVTGITAPAAANGNYVHQGVIFNMEYWKHETLDYYLFNDEYSSARYWNIDVDTDDGDTDYLFYIVSEAGTPVGLTGWSRGTGITGDPLIEEANPAPDIMVRGNGVAIVDDDASPSFADHTHFGSLVVASGSRARTFTIENNGNAVLTLSGPSPYVAVSGAAAGDFSVTAPPAATIAAYGSTTFTVAFDPAAEGTRSAALSIASNDDDESPYNFSIQGSGIIPRDLIVTDITTPAAANGAYVYQGILYEFPYWLHESGGYYIYNDEYSGSRYWEIDTDTNDTAANFYSNDHGEDASPVNVVDWHAETGSSGSPTIVYSGPEMAVEGNSVAITDGDATPSATDHTDFGPATAGGGSLTRTFTIRNTGPEPLALTGASPYIEISGAAAADFSVTAIPSPSVAAGASTTFQVTFTPTAGGARAATLSLANDDSDENPYDFAVQGTGITPPVVSTEAVSSITSSSAVGNGTISDLGFADPTAHGVCWNTTGTPTLADSFSDEGAAATTGAFTTTMGGLSAYTTYHVRAYATNSAGTAYGGEVTFTTSPVAPAVTTQAVSDITAASANGNGTIASLGVPNPTAHGVCWNTTGTPTLADDFSDEGAAAATGAFATTMGGLSAYTAYHVRAYASNAAGTAYGGEVTFTTSGIAPTVTTQAVSAISATGATGNGTVTDLGVPNPTAHGVCWNTSGTPTVADSSTNAGAAAATGVFSTIMGGLSAYTTYHVRAYATNSAGTAYGGEVTFTTSAVAPGVTTQAVSAISATGATGNGTVTDLGVPNPTAHGVCWNTTGAPTVADSSTNAGAAAATGAFSTIMGGLSAYTTYHVRAYATNAAGTTYGGEVTFTTSAVAPVVTTQAVTAITATGAVGNGTITDLGAPAPTAHGVCWNTVGAPTLADSSTNEGAATATGAFAGTLTGLAANTAYFVRAYAINAAGTAYGGEVTFTTSAVAPTVTTQAAAGVTTGGATLNGTVNANNQSATVTFEYGPTSAYGSTLAAVPSPVNGALATPVSVSVTGLLPNSVYHFRAAAVNATGAAYGLDETFTTLPAPPTVVTQAAGSVTALAAALHGTVNASNQSTVVTFEYGPTTAYGAAVTASPSPVDGTIDTAVTGALSGLVSETIYHFRAVGQNATGTTYGADLTFATLHLNIAPSANDDDYAGTEDEVLRVPAPGVLRNDSDPEASPLRASLLTQTSHGRITLHADGDFVYSPDAGYNGLDHFTYAASDGELDSAAAEVILRVRAVNDPPTIAIRAPADGARVNGILTIAAEADDDRRVAKVDFTIDGAALDDKREKTIDLGDHLLDVSDGLALALDREGNLLLLTNDLQARMLLGAEAGIEDVCTDLEGGLCLQRRDGLGVRWLRINPESGRAEALAANDSPRRPPAMGVSRLRRSLTDRGDEGWIAIRNGKPTSVDLMEAAITVRSWQLPLTRIEQARRRGSWLALEGGKDGDRTIFLIDTGDDTAGMRTFTSKPLADWDVLADGTLLVGRPARAGDPGAWGTWRRDPEGWSFREGQALSSNLAALAALPDSQTLPAEDAAGAGGTYTRVWNTWGAAAGPHTIEAVASDDEGTLAADRITVFVENILLTLDIQRKSEKLWIIRRDYAEIAVAVDNPNRIDVSSYVLERGGDGAWAVVREIAPAEFQDNRFSSIDNDIEANKTYTYRLRAVDRDGATIATSPSVTI
jgi:hypothetical protein